MYALDAEKGGCLNGNQIKYAMQLLDIPNLTGRRILDYCCGTGRTAIYFALCGAEVWAFDGSTEAIDIALESAQLSGVSHLTHFRVANAESLPFENVFFAILNHSIIF